MLRRLRRAALVGAVLVLVILLAGAVGAWAVLSASLPRESGEAGVPGLSAPVEVSRDALGVPVVRAASFEDGAGAIGFLHAQDRFFQMDILRRMAAGELAELVGPAALESDRARRPFAFRAVSRSVLASLPDEQRRWLDAYARGVNAGLADLGARPPEYLLFRNKPREWLPEDSVLAMFAMFDSLSLGARFERTASVMQQTLPPELVAFLLPETTRFDAPLVGPGRGAHPPAPVPEIPPRTSRAQPPETPEPQIPGSNNWAVARSKTRDGRAILANDMHLGLSVPGTWYRLQIEIGDERTAGVSLPGVPMIVAGSNGRVAWGFTNVTGDFEDFVIVDPDPADPSRYLTPDGSEAFGVREEFIRVRAGTTERLEVRTTRWGPVVGTDPFGRTLALAWIALDAERVNLSLFDMMGAESVDDAVRIARSWWGPPQNVALADSSGRIAWVVSGWLPERGTSDGRFPASWAREGVGWRGRLAEPLRPVLVDPAGGVIATANNRTLPLDQARRLGRHWSSGERAGRILALLDAGDDFDERDMLAVQLDTDAALFRQYRAIAMSVVGDPETDARLAAAASLLRDWNARADADDRAFSVLVSFRAELRRRVLDPLFDPCRAGDESFRYFWFQSDEPLLRVLEERPASYLPAGAESWDALLRDCLRASVDARGSAKQWGDRNRASIRHPISAALGPLGGWLNMPADPLPGHATTVRVQSPTFGASQRMVVSPSNEADAILHIPAGQSGHPLSPHYASSHSAWVRGDPTPFLAGPPVSAFRLLPQAPDPRP